MLIVIELALRHQGKRNKGGDAQMTVIRQEDGTRLKGGPNHDFPVDVSASLSFTFNKQHIVLLFR